MVSYLSKSKRDKYLVMRHLFRCSMTYKELENETGMFKLRLIKAIGKLIKDGSVKKEYVYFDSDGKEIRTSDKYKSPDLPKALDKKGRKARYRLGRKGEDKLGYYEYKFRCYENIELPHLDYYKENYLKEILEIVKECDFYGKPPVGYH